MYFSLVANLIMNSVHGLPYLVQTLFRAVVCMKLPCPALLSFHLKVTLLL